MSIDLNNLNDEQLEQYFKCLDNERIEQLEQNEYIEESHSKEYELTLQLHTCYDVLEEQKDYLSENDILYINKEIERLEKELEVIKIVSK